jgi:acetolactate synthase-1/2/3 large subunit
VPEAQDFRVADLMAQMLREAGVRYAFGMPGGEVIAFLDALERADISFVLARNETAAAMMAAGACVGGQAPGLLVTTLGPGLANAVNGIADAWQERAPLLIVSGVVERSLRARYTHQIVDHAALLAPLVKASFEIEAEAAGATMARAIRLALTPPFGPVHIDLSPATASLQTRAAPPFVAPLTHPAPHPEDPAINAASDRLHRAQRPLILAGFDAARDGAGDLRAAVARLGIPVITTYKAKGAIDERSPSSLGAAGLSPLADTVLLDLVRRADCILLAGYDPIEMRPGWLQPFPDPDDVIDLGGFADHGMHEAGLRIAGATGPLLRAVFAGLEPRAIWRDGEPATARAKLDALFAAPAAWGPHAIFGILREACPDESIVTVDSGAHRILLSQQWRARAPLELLQSAGWCTMGSALPLALGAKCAHPERPVFAVMGDGGFEMTMGECGTLRDKKAAVTLVVLQDEGLELIALKQDQSHMRRRGVAMGATDYAQVAEAFGGAGFNVETPAELRTALSVAATRDGFTLIACRIRAGAYDGRI